MSTAIINLDLTNSIDVVRALVGDFDTDCPIMSDNMYQQLLDMFSESDESIAEWFAAIRACEIITRHYAQDALRSRERVNAVEVEQYGNERFKAYQDACEWLKNNPPLGSGADGLPLFYLGGGCNNGLRASGISIGWFSSALSACWAVTWENGYYRPYVPGYNLRFLGTIETNLCTTCYSSNCSCGC